MMSSEESDKSFLQKLGFFLPVLFVVVSLTFAILRLQFETGTSIAHVLPVIPCVFIFTYWLPRKCALPAMIIGSIIASYRFLGIYNTIALLFTIGAYVLLFYLFKKTTMRIVFALLMTGALAFLRLGLLHLPVIPLAVPVAGTMIMFRFVLMIYEHHYNYVKSNWVQKFAYLLLLPALAFPLYPIVDYKNFIALHRPQDGRVIRMGLTRICAGLLFMLLHRILYLYVFPSYVEVHNAISALTYMTGSYLYVVHILGIFWIGIGYLSLLGFDMPPVFNNMFLIDSFRDIWRRINTYWRDFMVKLVYYPLFFKLRKKTKLAILITSLITLSISAMLHGWQWYWIQGTIAFQPTGIIFWTIIGLVISINLAIQPKGEGGIPIAAQSRSLFSRALRIVGMMAFMSFMWSLWNSTGIADWLYFMHFYGTGTALQYLALLGAIAILVLIIFAILKFLQRPPGYHLLSQPIHTFAALGLGLLLVLPTFDKVLDLLPAGMKEQITSITKMRLTQADQGDATENYYNRMLASDGNGMRPWEMHTRGGNAQSGLDDACIRRNDILVRELIPNKVTVLDGWTITTNEWGMRDKSCSKQKPAGVYRIAILGASYEMGSGVAQDSIFDNITENLLHDSLPGMQIEILNFSVGGYHLPQQVWLAENKLPQFSPDLVLCFVHPSDATRNASYMSKLIKNGTDLVYPELYDIKKSSGAEQGMSENELKNRLYPYTQQIALWSLQHISTSCDSMHARFGVVYIPSLVESTDVEFYKGVFETANGNEKNIHADLFFDFSDIFRGHEDEYKLVKDPTHPNGKGHYLIGRLLAHRLTDYFRVKT